MNDTTYDILTKSCKVMYVLVIIGVVLNVFNIFLFHTTLIPVCVIILNLTFIPLIFVSMHENHRRFLKSMKALHESINAIAQSDPVQGFPPE